MRRLLILLLFYLLYVVNCLEILDTFYNDRYAGYSYYCTQPLGISNGRVPNEQMSGSISEKNREAFEARLNGLSSWRPVKQDNEQFLEVDLGVKHNVTSMAIQGNEAGGEYVKQFIIEFSNDGINWNFYTNKEKILKYFEGNFDDNTPVFIEFDSFFIARFVRFRPYHWHNFIALRVELYGCKFKDRTVYFDEQSFIQYDAANFPIIKESDWLRFRFRSSKPNGVIFYAKGAINGDFYLVELKNGSIHVVIDVGSFDMRSKTNQKLSNDGIDSGNYYENTYMMENGYSFSLSQYFSSILSYNTESLLGDIIDNADGTIMGESSSFGDGIIEGVCGSLLDDNLWHSVSIRRSGKLMELEVDHLKVYRFSSTFSSFNQLNFDSLVNVGGTTNVFDRGITSSLNFTGCLQSFNYEGIDFIDGIENNNDQFKLIGQMSYSCGLDDIQPFTLFNYFSQLTIKDKFFYSGAQKSYNNFRTQNRDEGFYISFELRSFQHNCQLFYTTFHQLYVGIDRLIRLQMYLEDGQIYISLIIPKRKMDEDRKEKIFLQNWPPIKCQNGIVNDGRWHQIELEIRTNRFDYTIDGYKTTGWMGWTIETPNDYYFGYTTQYIDSFDEEYFVSMTNLHENLLSSCIGCIRNININNKPINSLKQDHETFSFEYSDIDTESCILFDRCTPNPCAHDGKCLQNQTHFSCDCSYTGYTGGVCHVSEYPRSCAEFKMSKRHDADIRKIVQFRDGKHKITIDLDGSGPIRPFEIECELGNIYDSTNETILHHHSEGKQTVDGYSGKGDYQSSIRYHANEQQLNMLIERSDSCRQHILYECQNSKLLNTNPEKLLDTSISSSSSSSSSGNLDTSFLSQMSSAYGWWVGGIQNQKMDYWGNSEMGTGRCACGLQQTCIGKGFCNCDTYQQQSSSIRSSAQLFDDINRMEDDSWNQEKINKKNFFINSNNENFYYSNIPNGWSADSGFIVRKEHLPIKQIHFGDTGSTSDNKKGIYKVGPLICNGDKLFNNVVTFNHSDAVLSFDSQVFRPTIQGTTSTLLQIQGERDFLEIRLSTGREVLLRFSAGHNAGVQVISIKTNYDLNDNEWHFVEMERNRIEARLRVDNHASTILEEQEQFRSFSFTSNLTIGAGVNYKNGFVGCFRALTVNGQMLDMKGLVEKNQIYGVSSGCVGKCDSSPCLNGGKCEELYDSFTCDCTFTPFRGHLCNEEVGTLLDEHTYIKYTIPDIGVIGTVEEFIRVGFVSPHFDTKENGGRTLIHIESEDRKEYFYLELQNNGGVRVKFHFGFDEWQRNTERFGIQLASFQFHEIKILRQFSNGTNRFLMQIDDYPPYVKNKFNIPIIADVKFDNPKYIYIGKYPYRKNEKGFHGCISRVQFNRYFPLKFAFREIVDPNIEIIGPNGNQSIREQHCDIDPIRYPPDPIDIPPDRRKPKEIILLTPPITSTVSSRTSVILSIIFSILLATAILIGLFCLAKHSSQAGTYRTYEEKGASRALDPDSAIMKGDPRHPGVTEKKEWFI
ncbi:hypothetical protein SNEBB_000026 [Seison nebaliae]|nr:hypothetical protein SNEBB_000026 [Seison nebaliae]